LSSFRVVANFGLLVPPKTPAIAAKRPMKSAMKLILSPKNQSKQKNDEDFSIDATGSEISRKRVHSVGISVDIEPVGYT
jgi:hypothetical protein